jgi:hypothetical protein
MNTRLFTRLARLEAALAPQLVSLVRYGWLATLPADYVGERHIVTVGREPTISPRFEWCEWEERPGAAPPDAEGVVPNDARRYRSSHDEL